MFSSVLKQSQMLMKIASSRGTIPACSPVTGFRESDSLRECHIPFFSPSPHVMDTSTIRKKEWLHRDSSVRTEIISFNF